SPVFQCKPKRYKAGGYALKTAELYHKALMGKWIGYSKSFPSFRLYGRQILNSFQVWKCKPKRIFIEISQKMKTIIVLAVALFLGSKVSATAQYPDKIIWR